MTEMTPEITAQAPIVSEIETSRTNFLKNCYDMFYPDQISDGSVGLALQSGLDWINKQSQERPGAMWDVQEQLTDKSQPDYNQEKMNVFWIEQIGNAQEALRLKQEASDVQKQSLTLMMEVVGEMAIQEAAVRVERAKDSVPVKLSQIFAGLERLPEYIRLARKNRSQGFRVPTFSPSHAAQDEGSLVKIICNICADAKRETHQSVKKALEDQEKINRGVDTVPEWLRNNGIIAEG